MKKISMCFMSVVVAGIWSLVFAEDNESYVYDRKNRRDPFVSIVDSKGIRPKEELFGPVEEGTYSFDLKLNAVVWDEKNPLAVINGKIYKNGDTISEKVSLVNVNRNSVIIDYHEREITLTIGGQKNENKK